MFKNISLFSIIISLIEFRHFKITVLQLIWLGLQLSYSQSVISIVKRTGRVEVPDHQAFSISIRSQTAKVSRSTETHYMRISVYMATKERSVMESANGNPRSLIFSIMILC